jgi:hypothetical protein
MIEWIPGVLNYDSRLYGTLAASICGNFNKENVITAIKKGNNE